MHKGNGTGGNSQAPNIDAKYIFYIKKTLPLIGGGGGGSWSVLMWTPSVQQKDWYHDMGGGGGGVEDPKGNLQALNIPFKNYFGKKK